MWIGSSRNRTDTPFEIIWPNQPMKMLGVYFSYDTNLCDEKKIGDKISKAKKIINMWKQRDLSLIGRIQIIKTFIISQFLYSISSIDIPEKYIKEIESLIYTFIWKGKKERLKRQILIKTKENGGLKVPCFRFIVDSVKLKWFIKLFDQNIEHVWALMVRQYLKKNNLDLFAALKSPELFTCTKDAIFPSFYYKSFKIWDEIVETEPHKRQLFIWYNPKIRINFKIIFLRNFRDIGIQYISHLFKPDGSVIAFEQWLHKGLSLGDYLNWAGIVSAVRKLTYFKPCLGFQTC